METWNQRLGRALEESEVSANSLAVRLGLPSPTIYAWLGSGHIKPTKRVSAEHLFMICRELALRPEWLLFGEGSPRQEPIAWPFVFTLDQYLSLPTEERYEVENLIHAKIVKHAGAR